MRPNLRDAMLKATRALPAGATTVVSSVLDIGPVTSKGDFIPSVEGEFLLEAPALTTSQLPDGDTITYDIVTSVNADLSSSTVVRKAALIQTGAGGAGAIAASTRYRPSTDIKQYFGFQATGVSGVAATGATAIMTYVS